jgi:GTP-binding protein
VENRGNYLKRRRTPTTKLQGIAKIVLSEQPIYCHTVQRFSIVNISSAIFDCSAPDLATCPDESLPEFAFIGRSNVGKSSLLNLLAGKENLARVSPTPGFTKLINFFTMNKNWRLVDLPGYGFAEGTRKASAKFNRAVLNYLEHRTNLCSVFALIESALPPQDLDIEFIEWLTRNAVPFVLVFTKIDKVPPATAEANIAAFMERISPWFEKPPAKFTCSAETDQGRQELLGVIDEAMTAITAEQQAAANENSSDENQTSRTREIPKKRPDRNRPW